MCFQAIQHAIFQFFESSEGKGVNDENDLVIYLGYKNYFDLISLTATLLVSGKRKVFEIEFHLKGSLDPKEIEVCKKEVCKMKVHPMKGMTYETAPSHIKKAWNKMKETVRKQRCGKTLSDIFGVKIAENSNIKRSQSLIKYHSNNGIATEKRYCKSCQEEFLVKEYSKQIYCSRRCQHLSMKDRTVEERLGEKRGKLFRMMCSERHGEKSPSWRGGKGNNYGEQWNFIRQEILFRDNFKCLICGNEDKLGIHHCLPYKIYQSNDESELKTTCKKCHEKIKPLENKEWMHFYHLVKNDRLNDAFILGLELFNQVKNREV